MKYTRILIFVLLVSLVLSGCGSSQEPYTYQSGGKTIQVYPAEGKLVCGLAVYHYTVFDSGRSTYYEISYPGGGKYSWTQDGVTGSGGGSNGYNDSMYVSGMTLVNAIQAGEDQIQPFPWSGLVVLGMGFALFRFPEFFWQLRYGWKFQNAEPSEAVLGYTRFLGIGAMAIGGLTLLVSLF